MVEIMKAQKVYEAIGDVFKPKTPEEMAQSLEEKPSSNQKLIFRVYSGVDAFVFPNEQVPKEEKIYLPYIDIIARTREEARQKVAKIFGQKIEDQDTNVEYDNYISPYVEIIKPF